MKKSTVIILLFVLFIAISAMAQQTWTKVNTSLSSFLFFGMIYAQNKFVGVGGGGEVYTSPNGTAWTRVWKDTINYPIFCGIVYASNQYVAVGSLGTIITSPDAVTWTTRASGSETKRVLFSVAYGNNQYIAVGDSGTIITSPDGITWTARTSGTEYRLQGIAFGNGTFVAVGLYGTIITSPDGITWTARTSGTEYTLYSIAYGNNTFLVGGSGEVLAQLLKSHDGITWTLHDRILAEEVKSIIFAANTFIAVNGIIYNFITYSNDTGTTWQDGLELYDHTVLECAAYGNNTFVVGGQNVIYTSPLVNAIRYTAPKAVGSQLLTITNNTARFTLKQAANTNLTLFDLSGKAVASLINGQKAAGMYNAALPLKFPQGRYILSLKAGEASCVLPIMITR